MKTFIKFARSSRNGVSSKLMRRHILYQWLKSFEFNSKHGIRWAF